MSNKYVSYSQYSQYTQCQRQWYLNYGLGMRENKPSINLTFGTAFHETLQNFLDVMYNKSVKEAEAIDLSVDFKDRFINIYKQTVDKLTADDLMHFSNAEQMREFYDDAIAILDYFKRNRKKYFTSKGIKLVGIEIGIDKPIVGGINVKGAIDLVLYDTELDKYYIYDIKTSTRGWSDKEKKDQTKINQILLYKRFFGETYNVPEENIEVVFFIVRRKVYENSEFVIPRISEFKPANGKKKVNEAVESFTAFVNEVYYADGKVIKKDYTPNPTKLCNWCPYNNKPELCDKKVG